MSLFRSATTVLAIIAGTLHASQATSVRMLRTSGTSLKSSTAAGTCKEWCDDSFKKKKSKVVCAWATCAGCQPCASESVPEPKPIPDPVPAVALTKKCLGWCGNSFQVQEMKPGSNKEKSNEVVCKWETCAGCERCLPESISNTVKNSEKCQDVPGWKNKAGKICNDYLTNHWCANGAAVPGKEWALGPKWNMPEDNCCVCGLTPPPRPANAEEKVILDNADGCNNHPCKNHGSCLKRADGMPICVCVGGFTGEFCEIPPSPGEIEHQDPSSDKAKRFLGTALASLNEKRSKNEMGPVSLKAIVSYTTQVISGTLHTFCIESQNDGFIQIAWDDFGYGPGPHLASVMPLHKIFKWVGEKITEMVCTASPPAYDGGLSAAGVSPGALAELQARRTLEEMKLKHKQHNAQSLIEAKTEAYPLPSNWDARFDHTRSDKCSALISEPADQGTCGSCYAFAALQTASIRACMAGHDISKKGFSVQDVLNCGSQWAGDMQNAVPPFAKGKKMANNCNGWLSLNVFEYATKYGLVDSLCQDYAHSGDPLTHFDEEAGAQECLLTNKGNVPANPEVEVSVGISEEYNDVLNSILPTIKNKAINSFTKKQNIAMANMDLTGFDLELFRLLGASSESHLAITIPKESKGIKRASLGRKIAPGETVSVDNMAFCDSSVKKTMGSIHAEPKVEPHCVARLQETYLKADKFSVHCKTEPQHRTFLSGPKGETLGGLDNSICECTAEERVYQKNWKPYPMSFNLAPKMSQLGSEARGECHRDKNSGEFDFEAEHKTGCGQVHNIFHSPVDVEGRTQSERIMQKAIMEGGAIEVNMFVVDSFQSFKGEGIYDKNHWERIDHKNGHALTLIGWGNENGKKFWWVKNSWGSSAPIIFKFARGKDLLGIESFGASWLTADPPGKAPSKSLKVGSGSNPQGFCPDSLLSENLLANNKFKVKHSCVSLKCYPAGCNLKFTWDCNILKRTYVDIISDSVSDTLSTKWPKEIWIKSASACIQNVYN